LKRQSHVLPSVRRRRRWWYYVLLPLMLAGACLAVIAFCVLGSDPAPTVTAIDFDVDASGDFARAAQEITLLNLAHEPGAVPEIVPSTDSELQVAADGCQPFVDVTLAVYPDPRWWLALRASRQHLPQVLALQRGTHDPVSISPGSVKGLASAAIPGGISDLKVFVPRGEEQLPIKVSARRIVGDPEEFTLVRFKVPDEAIRHVLLRSVIGQNIVFTFKAPWVHPNGFRRCYIALPALIEGEASSIAGLGAEGLAIQSTTSVAGRGPLRGTTRLEVSNGSVAPSISSPPPDDSAITPTWACHRRRNIEKIVSPDCHANVVVDQPQREAWQQVALIILGALGSAGFVGVFDGMRRILVPFD
jgi:hypothetical protein